MPPSRSGELPTSKRSQRPSADTPASFTLLVVEGPDAGLSFTIDSASPARVLVGHSPLCQLVLTDVEVSRRHLSIRAAGTTLEARDLDSTNGTTVNGVSIREVLLRGGESLRLGATVLSVVRGEQDVAALARASSFGRIAGESRSMRKLYPVLERLATAEGMILIEGEAGTGKELCAEELHARRHADRPFITMETTALAPAEIEAMLFGQEGLVEAADGGTLVIDDASDLPLTVQSRLLALIGESGSRPPWIILTTSRDLDRAVTEGRFRADVLARVGNAHVTLPPLRDREGDTGLLARRFWAELGPPGSTLPPDFLSRFEHYPWPGNVRELRSAVESRLRLGELAPWQRTHAERAEGDFIGAVVDQGLAFAKARQIVLTEFERRYVVTLVEQHGGSVQRAAAASGLAQRYFQLIRARHRAKV